MRTIPTRRRRPAPALGATALGAAGLLALTACGGSGFDEGGDTSSDGGSSGSLSVLIGSSGDAETDAVTAAVAAWSEESGVEATVQVASDLTQELSQGFASGDPADVFYVSADQFQTYASNGSLYPYGADLDAADDFYPSLVDQFTYDGELVCAPKDFSTLGLIINTSAWEAAGLTEADVPTTWEQLTDVAGRLTTDGQVGLGISGEYARVGAFLAQAGGTMTDAAGTEATVDSPENVEGLTYVQQLLASGSAAYAADLGTGWGGEAFGTGAAAMTIEGNWITGAMENDYPDVAYQVAELPAGPAGQGTLQFTNCWGVAADSSAQSDAVDLVQHLTAADQQLAFADAFGVMPSVQSAADGWKEMYPEMTAFIDSAAFAQNVVNARGAADVITDFNAQLEGLKTGDPAAILGSVQTNLQAVLDENAS
ncbi:sugar ABC transporter substrate-binding protein [Cellulomonas triticagri]|uniref:Extracellular solute-binding protein n=1 Tax=Cellulomonas triticagri TaxID=2483352 RepID=A0A3M2ISI8_9CELL|nr:extracellular solute-binding protein [Cellulomonas triticagri]RMI04902.1 extracellular solute-binding protein [Cellulomonas triticagri]